MQNQSSIKSGNLKSLAITPLIEGEILLHSNDTLPLSDDLMTLVSFGGGRGGGGSSSGN